MNRVTLSIDLELAYWVAANIAGTADYGTMTELGDVVKNLDNAPLDTIITVTISYDAVVSIFEKLTVLKEGVAAKYNDRAFDAIMAVIGDHLELGGRLLAIRERNAVEAASYIDAGKRALQPIIDALTND